MLPPMRTFRKLKHCRTSTIRKEASSKGKRYPWWSCFKILPDPTKDRSSCSAFCSPEWPARCLLKVRMFGHAHTSVLGGQKQQPCLDPPGKGKQIWTGQSCPALPLLRLMWRWLDPSACDVAQLCLPPPPPPPLLHSLIQQSAWLNETRGGGGAAFGFISSADFFSTLPWYLGLNYPGQGSFVSLILLPRVHCTMDPISGVSWEGDSALHC